MNTLPTPMPIRKLFFLFLFLGQMPDSSLFPFSIRRSAVRHTLVVTTFALRNRRSAPPSTFLSKAEAIAGLPPSGEMRARPADESCGITKPQFSLSTPGVEDGCFSS